MSITGDRFDFRGSPLIKYANCLSFFFILCYSEVYLLSSMKKYQVIYIFIAENKKSLRIVFF